MESWERLTEIADRHGAVGIGVCTAEPFSDVRDELERRREDGSHAGLGFTYMAPDVSTDVAATYPWVRRLVVVAWSYLPDAGSPGPSSPGTGRVARFATENHYLGLRAVLTDIAAELRSRGFEAEMLSDDDRLVDRAAAVRAGVGWWGKSTMVLSLGAGPWMLLGSVATDAELPPTPPMTRGCGTCTACVPACPTGALIAPGVLDARRCLARWAQAPGVIPDEYRIAMDDRVYGCDSCLDACPPGSRAVARSNDTHGRVDLVELLGAADEDLLADYGHFYLPKRNPRILRRNALVALGNRPTTDAIGVLAGYLGHPDPVLRLHAAWAVGRVGGAPAHAVLTAAADSETRPEVRNEIASALSRCAKGPDSDSPVHAEVSITGR